MKTCSKCKVEKDRSEFSKDKHSKTGLKSNCKSCSKAYYEANKERILPRNMSYYRDNRGKFLATKKAHYEANRSGYKANNVKWRDKNRPQHNASSANRRAAQLQATPPWLNVAHHVEMEEMYRYHQIFKGIMPERLGWHVDHIEPLQGESVRGLHVPWNLQVLPARENITKSNNVSTTGADI